MCTCWSSVNIQLQPNMCFLLRIRLDESSWINEAWCSSCVRLFKGVPLCVFCAQSFSLALGPDGLTAIGCQSKLDSFCQSVKIFSSAFPEQRKGPLKEKKRMEMMKKILILNSIAYYQTSQINTVIQCDLKKKKKKVMYALNHTPDSFVNSFFGAVRANQA